MCLELQSVQGRRQGTETHVNIITDGLGTWEDRPVGIMTILSSQSIQSAQALPGPSPPTLPFPVP